MLTPRARCVPQGSPRFSPVYEFQSTRDLGITAGSAFTDATSSRAGVWGADVSLRPLQTLMRAASGAVSAGVVMLVGLCPVRLCVMPLSLSLT